MEPSLDSTEDAEQPCHSSVLMMVYDIWTLTLFGLTPMYIIET